MKRRLIIAISILVICGVGLVISASSNIRKGAASAPQERANPMRQSSAGTIDGAIRPELIPDHVAYSLLFDMIAGRQTEVDKNRIRSYLKQVGFGNVDSEALIAVAEEYRQRDVFLGYQADEIKARNHPNHLSPSSVEKKQLKQLQKQHEQIVQDVIASLPSRLSADGLLKLRQHINERVKRKTKIFAE